MKACSRPGLVGAGEHWGLAWVVRIDQVGVPEDESVKHSPDLGPKDVGAWDTAFLSKPRPEGKTV